MYLNRYSYEEIVCGTAGHAKNATPVYGYIEGYLDAWGPATFAYDSQFTAAHAEATLSYWSFTYNSCTESYTEGSGTISVSLDWSGSGDLVKSRSTFSERVPSEYQYMERYSSAYRYQTVSGTIDGAAVSGGGVLGKTTYTFHYND